MKSLMGVINLDYEHDFLNELTYFRCGAAVPFAGRYRLVDFVISSMVNSSITDIAVFARRKYRSLMDHLGTGDPWDLDRKRGGLFILPPDWNDPTDISQGDLQHFHNNRDFFNRGQASYVLISGSQHVCNINYDDVFQFHLENGADVTVIFKQIDNLDNEYKQCHKIEFDKNGRVTSINNDHENHHVSLDMLIIKKDLLMNLVDDCIAHGHDHFFRDGIMHRVAELKIFAYEYKGFHAVINSLESFYKHNLALLNPNVYRQLFSREQVILTKVKDEPPAKYLSHANVQNSLVANGCVIDGKVENSILFRGVHIEKGAVIKNSIIMQRCEIKENAHVENVILDKDITLSKDRVLIGASELPFVVAKRKVM